MTGEPVRSAERGTPPGGEAGGSGANELARLSPVLLPVVSAGAAVVAAAFWHFAARDPSAEVVGGVLVLLAGALVAEAFPVPLEALPGGHVAMSAVFIVGTAVLYGWAPAAIAAFVTRGLLEIVQRRPLIRLAYNGGVYALAGAAAGAAVAPFAHRHGIYFLFLQVPLAATAFYVVNIPLVTAIVARWAGEEFQALLRRWVYWTAVPSAIMASVTVMLAAMWRQTPFLTAALVGPMLAIALYQRSMHRALKATRLALTDPVTGLGNHRHFHERLQTELGRAELAETGVSLCLVDIDDFKRINDRYGHPAGDRVLEELAAHLRHGGEGFRLGGDEFALILSGCDQESAVGIAETVVTRLASLTCEGESITVSAGVATFPENGVDRTGLLRAADTALYRAKDEGKNRVCAHQPAPPAPAAVQAV